MVKASETSKDKESRKGDCKPAGQENLQKSWKTLAVRKETLQNIDSVQRRPQKFIKVGKRRIHYLLDQMKPCNCNQDFAKRLELKVKIILFIKCCNWTAC